MTPLSILLTIKIFGTLVPIALPFLLFPKHLIEKLSNFEASDIALYRFYGVAILALLVGYAGGLFQLQEGVFPAGVVAMGLVSNAGIVMAITLTGRLSKMPVSAIFFGSIAIGLLVSHLNQEMAMTPLNW
ncbi:MAG: hypothetical protein MRY72_02980 [Aquisalinus sp.]|nr:hypothetical protein [Aquisalinus sp.]